MIMKCVIPFCFCNTMTKGIVLISLIPTLLHWHSCRWDSHIIGSVEFSFETSEIIYNIGINFR